ncbi:hypothetical protein, partial [Sulfitobacter pontiacus]|uniref:hypothetical protein n=1 Tax=Sulfitobacter pontiacus TaxID=60137 RepID=UPI0019CF5C45
MTKIKHMLEIFASRAFCDLTPLRAVRKREPSDVIERERPSGFLQLRAAFTAFRAGQRAVRDT